VFRLKPCETVEGGFFGGKRARVQDSSVGRSFKGEADRKIEDRKII
jgi:hypothetical protein